MPGVPDLCLPVPQAPCHGLFIEMKRRDASPSDNARHQRAWQEEL